MVKMNVHPTLVCRKERSNGQNERAPHFGWYAKELKYPKDPLLGVPVRRGVQMVKMNVHPTFFNAQISRVIK